MVVLADIGTAIAGFVGVAIGGVVTYLVQRLAEDRADERDRVRREHEQRRATVAEAERVVGIARVHREQLFRAQVLAATVQQGEAFKKPDELRRLFPPLPLDDLQLIAFHLTAEKWQKLTDAHMTRDSILGALSDSNGAPPPPDKRGHLDTWVNKLAGGIDALRSLERGAIRKREETDQTN